MSNIYFNRAVLKTLSAASKPRKDNLNAERYKFYCINCIRSTPINIYFFLINIGTFQEHKAQSIRKVQEKKHVSYIILSAELLKPTELSGEMYYKDCSVLFTFKYLKS